MPIVEDENEIAEIVRSMKIVAVVGMKDDNTPNVPAYEIPKAVALRGIRVIPVNPTIAASQGEKAYPRLADVPDRFDMVNVFRRSEAIPEVAKEVLALPKDRRPTVVWLQTGIRNDEAAKKLSTEGLSVVQDRCLAVYAARYR